jgi:glutathione S-transferase
MNDELILHHYETSPFSEKVRLMLGFKGLAWRSVRVPVIMPKPDVVALTGGYRRTPFVQLGADVYCDTALIAQLLEQRVAAPTLFPADQPLAPIVAQWADSTLFWTLVSYVNQPAGAAHLYRGVPPEAVQAFMADRAPFTAGVARQSGADATANLGAYLRPLDASLAAGRRHLLGEALSIADFSVAHCLWFVRRAGPLAEIVEQLPHLNDWLNRMLAIGHGPAASAAPAAQRMDSAEALALAAAANRHVPCQVNPGLGFEAGDAVTVAASDYGRDPVSGTLVGLSASEVVLRREDPRAGVVHVHFPRAGYQIKKEKTA